MFSTKALTIVLSAATLLHTVRAIGDFPCAGSTDSQSCAAWSVDPQRQGNISTTAVCQPDPMNPSMSYCGYAGAACSTNLDCDYGSCGSDGKCKGYAGDPCPNGNTDCQAFFFCGTDGTCGGTGAPCANGSADSPIPSPDQQCTSNSCDQTAKTCAAPPAEGMAIGSACGSGSVCASTNCVNNLCAVNAAQPQASNPGGRRTKRYVLNGSGPNVRSCPSGMHACAVGRSLSEGFECIDAMTNLESCGGCVGNGGQDCTAIRGVEGVTCQRGVCQVLSCKAGFVPSTNGMTCLRV